MNVNELLKRYTAGEKDFGGIDLPKAPLQAAILRGISLKGAELSGATLPEGLLMSER